MSVLPELKMFVVLLHILTSNKACLVLKMEICDHINREEDCVVTIKHRKNCETALFNVWIVENVF